MKENHPKTVLDSIADAYFEQFEQDLDPRLLHFVVEKEIQKKREAFLQLQLSANSIGLDGLSDLSKHLKKRIKKNSGNDEKNGVATEKKTRHKKTNTLDSKKERLSINGKNSRDFKFEIETDLDLKDLSEDEIKKLKRRAYARQYYHRKKEENSSSTRTSAKLFKTTPEQRAYQRAYYKRRKAKNQNEDELNVLTKAFEANSHEKTKSKNTAKNELALNSGDRSHVNDPSDYSQGAKKPSVNYDMLAEDRMAIENAFKSDLSNDSFNFPEGGLGSSRDSLSAATPYATKTKLRKAKPSINTTS